MEINFTERHRRFVQFCVKQAEQSEMLMKHGCVIVSGGKIIAFGKNHNRTSLRNKTLSSFHAEISAMSYSLRGSAQTCTFIDLRREEKVFEESKCYVQHGWHEKGGSAKVVHSPAAAA